MKGRASRVNSPTEQRAIEHEPVEMAKCRLLIAQLARAVVGQTAHRQIE